MKKCIRIFLAILGLSVFFSACAFASDSTSGSASSDSTPVSLSLSASDLPDGFAGVGFKGLKTDSSVTVSNKKDLLAAIKKGGVIYVDGMIDLSEGMLPEVGGGSNPALDAFIKKNSSFSTYSEYREAYAAACTLETEDSSKGPQSRYYETMHTLNTKYRDVIRLSVKSNTILIGLNENSGFSGGCLSVSGVSNVILRNLKIVDAYDPFPHHEKNDGYNAQHDAVSIENSKNIWVDHCTFADTKSLDHVLTGGKTDEKWQTYDGLCDITKSSDNVTVSYCKFMNHSKTMLIGSSDSEQISAKNRKVTLHHNYFYNCASRLPMVRLSWIHSYNNYFDADSSAPYGNSYALGVRYNSLINSENNYYGSGIKNSYAGHSSKYGTVYSSGEADNSKSGKKSSEFNESDEPLFEIPYKYEKIPAEQVPDFVKANAGTGTLSAK